MPGSSGAPLRSFRVPEPIWLAFVEATEQQGTNPRTALRSFVRWYTGLSDDLPERPAQDQPDINFHEKL
jgi:hypothetical protein